MNFDWEAQERRKREFEVRQRDEWFAENGTSGPFPDLSFETPDCPICLRSTTCEDGQFICEVCDIVWPSNGYGHEAEWVGEAPAASGNEAAS